AALAIRTGKAHTIVNVFSVAWATQRADMVGGPGEVHAAELFKQNLEVPFGWFPQPVYFATIARRHMHDYGTTPAQLGAIVLACYDPFTIVSLMQIEDMGFCKKGEGGPFVAGTALHFDGGGLPCNTHGGMLSHAYVLGIAHVVEVVRQLRGQAAAQVKDAEIGVYGGYTG